MTQLSKNEALQSAVARLDPVQQRLVVLRHGLDDQPPRTLAVIAQDVGLTVGEVREQLDAARERMARDATIRGILDTNTS